MSTLLSVKNVSYEVRNKSLFGFDKKPKPILKDINFSLDKNKVLGIAGESGSGKTTLAKIIAGIIKPSSGEIILNRAHADKNKRTSPVQILFQNNSEILNPYRVIKSVVTEALQTRNGSTEDTTEEMAKIFKEVNFNENLWNRKGYQLSGGERQRAALARLLAVKPELLILDEPFSAQDPSSQVNLLHLLKKINSDFNVTMICIAHNLQLLNQLCDQLLIIYKGAIVEAGPVDKLLSSPAHPYTKFLIKAGQYGLSADEIKYETNELLKS